MSCKGFAKYSIIFFNFLIVLAGIAIIVIGSIVAKNDFTGSSKVTSTLAIVVGISVFFIAFLGCCGAMKENSCMLTMFAVVLLILFVIELVVGILALVTIKGVNLEDTIAKELLSEMDKDAHFMDNIQKELQCCGAHGPSDYKGHVPASCGSYEVGCAHVLADLMSSILKGLGIVTIFFAFLEVAGAVFACYVKSQIGNNRFV